MKKAEFGLIGLGVMGRNLGFNLLDKGVALSVYNRMAKGEEKWVRAFLEEVPKASLVHGFQTIELFVNSLASPRKILLMVKAGVAIDQMIQEVLPFLSKGDILLDGGNSHFLDTAKRQHQLLQKGIHFIGTGISGGEHGARNGPSIMPSGVQEAYDYVQPFLEKIAAKDKKGIPCCTYVGKAGSGHFIKMVHNGIEYGEMQLIAEIYSLLKTTHSNDAIASIFETWNQGDLSSFLLDITIPILRKKEGKNYLLDLVLDKAEHKGTGVWSSRAAMSLSTPSTIMTDAVFARYISSFKEQRTHLSQRLPQQFPTSREVNVAALKTAYQYGRILNHHQGFELMQQASLTYKWALNLSEIARIWTNGCIIRSNLMEALVRYFQEAHTLLEHRTVFKKLHEAEQAAIDTLSLGLHYRLPMPALNSAHQYWLGMTTRQLSANLIQAQRDAFGAHTFQRTDASENDSFHVKWV